MNKRIVIEVDANLKPLADAVERLIEDVIESTTANPGGRSVPYVETEKRFERRTADIERAAHAIALASLDVDVPRVSVGGKLYNRLGRSETSYFSAAGPVRLERCTYREAGVRNGKMIDPIALRIGATNSWLPKAAQAMAHLMQQGTAREAERTGELVGRLAFSASSFERVGHQVGALYREERADIEDLLIEELTLPDDAASISVSLDRVSVPMEEERKRPPGRPRKDAPKRSVVRQYRMAWCGTLTFHDKEGKGIETIRYGAMPKGDVDHLCGRIAADALKLREQREDMKLVHLADGAADLWRLLEQHFPVDVFGDTHALVDFWHVIEKLSAAAAILQGSETSAQITKRWKKRLRYCGKAADEILVELQQSGKEDVRNGDSKPVHEAITYLQNHRSRMNYAAARKAGLPIGSGNVEATCKSLFAIRMKRAGSRWHEETGEDIVQLRALALSNRWDPAMKLFAARQRTAVRAA